MKRKNFVLLALLSAAFLIGYSKSGDSAKSDLNNEPKPTIKESQNLDNENNTQEAEPEVVKINVTSESLTADGKWLTVINSTDASPAGSNLSPQLSWDEVEGAGCYAVYMVDNSAGCWLHWLAKNVKVNNLSLGSELEESSYIGPYPPSGTHEYEVIVYALKTSPDEYPGVFDNNLVPLSTIEKKLDTADGKPGNIIGKGSITGTVTVGEVVE